MYKYIKYYDIGYNEGINAAICDKLNGKKRKFKELDISSVKSKLYDMGYIDGYNITYKKLSLKK